MESNAPMGKSKVEAGGGMAAHLFLIQPDTSAAEFKTIQPFFNGGL
jgi:hypothetical protein